MTPAMTAISTGRRSAWAASVDVGSRPAISHRLVARWLRSPIKVPAGNATTR
jgi:hypothetical protein